MADVKRIIVARHLPRVELAPLRVNYDLTVEEMIAGYPSDTDITSVHLPNCRRGKTGVVTEQGLCLVNPTRPHYGYSDPKVARTITAAGYIFEEMPVLASLKDHAKELWEAGIEHIVARGSQSSWKTPDYGWPPRESTYVVRLSLCPTKRRFGTCRIISDSSWWDNEWFLCRKASMK